MSPNDWIGLYVFGGLLIAIAALFLGSFVSTIWLRLAALWLGFKPIPYLTAYKSALITNFTLFALNLATGLSYGLNAGLAQMSRYSRMNVEMVGFGFSPTFYLLTAVSALAITGLILCRTLPVDADGRRLPLTDGLALAAFYQALCIGFAVGVVVLVYSLIASLFILSSTAF